MNIKTEQLIALLGSEDAAQRFVKMFLEQLPAQMTALRTSYSTGDLDTLHLTAHGLKSQCRYLGLEVAAGLLQRIENEPGHTDMGQWLVEVEGALER